MEQLSALRKEFSVSFVTF